MTTVRKIDSALKTLAVSAIAGLMLIGCNGDTEQTKASENGRSSYETATDHALGKADAPITVVEYASVTCTHCANWHTIVWDDFRKEFVDTGKVRYVFREFPTSPVELATAGHLIANCAPDDKFFSLIGVQMKRQREILSSNDIRAEYVGLAKMAGMDEQEFEACMANEEEMARLEKIVEDGFNMGVTGTPTFFINGKKESVFKIEEFRKRFAEILGEPVPEDAPKKDGDDDKSAQ